jgi:hypothetical protein
MESPIICTVGGLESFERMGSASHRCVTPSDRTHRNDGSLGSSSTSPNGVTPSDAADWGGAATLTAYWPPRNLRGPCPTSISATAGIAGSHR